MNKPWSELPNSHHIDWVIKSVKENSQLWSDSYYGVRDSAWVAARRAADAKAKNEARHAAWDAVWDTARMAVYDAAQGAASREQWVSATAAWRMSKLLETESRARAGAEDAVKYALWDEVKYVVWDTILTLVAYDDCDQYLNMSYEKLHVYAMLSEKPQAILLLPMVNVKEKLYQSALKYNCIF